MADSQEENELADDFKQKTLEWAASLGDAKPSGRLEFLKQFIGTLTEDELKRLKSMTYTRKRKVRKDDKKCARLTESTSAPDPDATPEAATSSTIDAANSSGSATPPAPTVTRKPWWEAYASDQIVAWDSEMVSKPIKNEQQNEPGPAAQPNSRVSYRQHPCTVDIVDANLKSSYSTKVFHETGSFNATGVWKYLTGFNANSFDNASFPKEDQVKTEVDDKLLGKLVITHGGISDYNALNLTMRDYDCFDLQSHWHLDKVNEHGVVVEEKHSLRSLAKYYLNRDHQQKHHTSFDDAVTTMELFEVYKRVKLQEDPDNVHLRVNTWKSYDDIPVLPNPVQKLFGKKKKIVK